MGKIEIHKITRPAAISKKEEYFFTDAGDVKIEADEDNWLRVLVAKQDGTRLFFTEVLPPKVRVFGWALTYVLDSSAFDFHFEETTEDTTVYCLDPRVVMSLVLMGWVMEKKSDYSSVNISDVLDSVPDFQEAKDFLVKNGIYRENPYSERKQKQPNELVDIPEEVRNLLK